MKEENKEKETSAAKYLPHKKEANISELAKAAAKCQGCDLYKAATQTVFGAGKEGAKVMFIGEQPGDHEDRQGFPFVGPAGKLLDQVLETVGIEKKNVYVTNAVKHFKFEERGKRRIHKKPKKIEIDACHPWLEAEVKRIKPNIIVCLGTTAAEAVFGKAMKISENRGRFLHSELGPRVLITVHPSSILRMPDREARHTGLALFSKDMKIIARELID